MNRLIAFGFVILLIPAMIVLMIYFPVKFLIVIAVLLFLLGAYDLLQKQHTILRNFPIIGHLRYIFEMIRPEIQQYFIATNQSDTPFNRSTRSVVYQRAKKALDTQPFGTPYHIDAPGYESARHSLSPTHLPAEEGRIWVGGPQCTKPYLASRMNISAMSYGALSKNAIMALNMGAKLGNFGHNTGEGGLSDYHLQGGDLIWQLGTALFGCRTKEGRFNEDEFRKKATLEVVKMIEIKISQGAKPSHGGILPGKKMTPEIAEIRGVEMGVDCLSPPTNPEFSTPLELLAFIVKLRELCGGKPVGFKLCIGKQSEFLGICKAMLQTGIYPDFITVDGAEGGTGAAPLEFSNHLGAPLNEGLRFVKNALVGIGVKQHIRIIASGKIATGFDLLSKICMGADIGNSARAMMFALGCIQSLQCNTNRCPTGVTTHAPHLMRGLNVEDKYVRVAQFQQSTVASFLELAGAVGAHKVDDLSPFDLFRQKNDTYSQSYGHLYEYLSPGDLINKPSEVSFAREWEMASAERF